MIQKPLILSVSLGLAEKKEQGDTHMVPCSCMRVMQCKPEGPMFAEDLVECHEPCGTQILHIVLSHLGVPYTPWWCAKVDVVPIVPVVSCWTKLCACNSGCKQTPLVIVSCFNTLIWRHIIEIRGSSVGRYIANISNWAITSHNILLCRRCV